MFNVFNALVAAKVFRMRFVMAVLLGTASFLSPLSALAGSNDVEATIRSLNADQLTMTLDDGKTYVLPQEFNFEGLESGVKVIVFFTEVDGKRIVDDLQVVGE